MTVAGVRSNAIGCGLTLTLNHTLSHFGAFTGRTRASYVEFFQFSKILIIIGLQYLALLATLTNADSNMISTGGIGNA